MIIAEELAGIKGTVLEGVGVRAQLSSTINWHSLSFTIRAYVITVPRLGPSDRSRGYGLSGTIAKRSFKAERWQRLRQIRRWATSAQP